MDICMDASKHGLYSGEFCVCLKCNNVAKDGAVQTSSQEELCCCVCGMWYVFYLMVWSGPPSLV